MRYGESIDREPFSTPDLTRFTTESRPQRLANVGVGRVLIALLLGAGYVAAVHVFGVLRRRRSTE